MPKELEKSLLYEKVVEGEMPPGKKDRLTEAELAIIRRWIEAGRTPRMPKSRAGRTRSHTARRDSRFCCGAALFVTERSGRKAGLDLRTKASMLRGGKSGPAIVLGKPDESLLIKKIRAERNAAADAAD